MRPLEKWSKNIHLLLNHFSNKGLPVPNIIKTDDANEYLEYLHGELIHPYKWTDEGLYAIGILAKDIHTAAKDFNHDKRMAWRNRSLYWILRNKKILENGII